MASRGRKRRFVAPAIQTQLDASQPKLLSTVLGFLVAGHAVGLLNGLARLSFPGMQAFTSRHEIVHLWVVFSLSSAVAFLVVWFFARRYGAAIYGGAPLGAELVVRSVFVAVVCSLPFLAKNLVSFAQFQVSTNRILAKYSEETLSKILPIAHNALWETLPYGATTTGVLLNSITSLTFPIVEEILITCLLFNWIAARIKIAFAVVVTALLFSAAHIPAFGFGEHLFGTFLMSISCILARLLSGSWIAPILCHLAINASIFLPRWQMAYLCSVLGV